MTLLRGFGLTIASALPLPGAIAGSGPPDLSIERGTAAAWTPTMTDGPYRAASADQFDFSMPGLARYTGLDRRRIVVDAAAGVDADDVADMLIATALPALLWARGEMVLHAAAAVLPGAATATAVLGESGAGKSTWLARVIADGARVLADDAIRVWIDDRRVIAGGLPGGYFRRVDDAFERRRFVTVPRSRQVAECPLGAITVLEPGPTLPLTGTAAVAALLRHRHRPRIARLLGLEPAALATFATIARLVPVTRLSRETSQ